MLKIYAVTVLALASAITGSAFAGSYSSEDAVSATPQTILAEARWSRAERDKTNAALAQEILAGKRAVGRSNTNEAHPDDITSASRDH